MLVSYDNMIRLYEKIKFYFLYSNIKKLFENGVKLEYQDEEIESISNIYIGKTKFDDEVFLDNPFIFDFLEIMDSYKKANIILEKNDE